MSKFRQKVNIYYLEHSILIAYLMYGSTLTATASKCTSEKFDEYY